MKNYYKALAKAKSVVNGKLGKKLGRNTFSNYSYFLPSQISNAVRETCEEVGLVTMFQMEQTEDGRVKSFLEVVHIETNEGRIYGLPTAIPDIKATNAAQKFGGSITYSKRYLETSVFDIAEDDKDPDATHNTKETVAKSKPKPTPKAVPADKFQAVIDWAVAEKKTVADIQVRYKLTEVQLEQLKERIK